MAVQIYSDDKTEITRGRPNLANIIAGMTWIMTPETPKDLYFDMVAYLIEEDGYCRDTKDIIYFGNELMKIRRDEVFKHMDVDNVITDKRLKYEDYEQILVALYEVPNRIKEVVFCAGIYNAKENGYNLSQIEGLRFHIFNEENKEELIYSTYSKYFTIESCMVFGRLYRTSDGNWSYRGENQGYIGDIGTLHAIYHRDRSEVIETQTVDDTPEEGYGHSVADMLKPVEED